MRAHSKTPPVGPGTIPAAAQSKYVGAFHPTKATLGTMRAHSAQSQPAARGRPAGSRKVRHYSWGGTCSHQDEATSPDRNTKGSGDPVGKRILSAGAATITAALLSSCAPATSQAPGTDPDVADTAHAETPPGFYLGEEFIEIGEFDPNKVELIDLCEEIPDEVLLEAGISPPATASSEFHRSIICSPAAADPEDQYGTFGLMSRSIDKSSLSHEGNLINANVESAIPGVFLYHTETDENYACWSGINTSKSMISVIYENRFIELTQEELCTRALKAFESIYIQLRGK